jgi:hypothetical protein
MNELKKPPWCFEVGAGDETWEGEEGLSDAEPIRLLPCHKLMGLD